MLRERVGAWTWEPDESVPKAAGGTAAHFCFGRVQAFSPMKIPRQLGCVGRTVAAVAATPPRMARCDSLADRSGRQRVGSQTHHEGLAELRSSDELCGEVVEYNKASADPNYRAYALRHR